MAVDLTPPATDAYSLWQRARSAVTSAEYPRRLAYTISIAGLDGEAVVTDHYRGSCDPDDGAIRVFAISDEQLAEPPPVPHGVNVSFNIGLCLGACTGIRLPLGHPPPYHDLLGEPLLAPTYTFGMHYAAPQAAGAPAANGSLRTIAIVAAQARDYGVTLLDAPTLDGVPTYHLAMKPLRRPKTNRLRELWIGTEDYLPRRANLAGNFTSAPLVDVPWTVDFAIIDGAPYVSRESTADTLYLPHHRVVRDAVIAFENIHEPSSIYDGPLMEPDATATSLVEPGS